MRRQRQGVRESGLGSGESVLGWRMYLFAGYLDRTGACPLYSDLSCVKDGVPSPKSRRIVRNELLGTLPRSRLSTTTTMPLNRDRICLRCQLRQQLVAVVRYGVPCEGVMTVRTRRKVALRTRGTFETS